MVSQRSGLTCLPVTEEIAGSNPVGTAIFKHSSMVEHATDNRIIQVQFLVLEPKVMIKIFDLKKIFLYNIFRKLRNAFYNSPKKFLYPTHVTVQCFQHYKRKRIYIWCLRVQRSFLYHFLSDYILGHTAIPIKYTR